MQKEEKVVIVLLLMALGSLAVAFWAFGPDESSSSMSGSTSSIAGEESAAEQAVQGRILEMMSTKSGGNLILRLDSTALPIFIPSSAGADEIRRRFKPGDEIRVKGSISEYGGENELKVSHLSDIRRA